MSFNANIITDSKSPYGNRLSSVVATFPRYLLAEFNTHKMISKNSASSRAIPGKKLRESVKDNPYIPEKWMKDHKGMQGSQFYDDPEDIQLLRSRWEMYKDEAIHNAGVLNGEPFHINETEYKYDVSKQIANRLLEPFMFHTALMSATEWENFFALRAEGGAEINFQKSAFMILDAMNASTPKELKEGEWHLPYGDNIDPFELNKFWRGLNHIFFTDPTSISKEEADELIVKICSAKCAGVSYVVIGEDGKEESIEKLLKRCDILSTNGHWSPMEHPARAMYQHEYWTHTKTFTISKEDFDFYQSFTDSKTYKYEYPTTNDIPNPKPIMVTEFGWCGNYRGFIQYRKMFINENRRDSRLIKK
jgi:thymidylate synthase ThyX